MSEAFGIQDLEKEVTCGICRELYNEPKVLPCLHYYCKECILKLTSRTPKGKPFPCPECRSPTILSEGDVDKLKSAFFINRFQSHFSTMQRVHGKIEAVCETCTSGATAVSFCRQCALFICHFCVEVHEKVKLYEGHRIASLQDLKEGRAKADIGVQEPSPVKCSVHKEELKVCCFDCDLLICRDCTVKDHREHNFEFSSVAAPHAKEKLEKKLEPLRKIVSNLSLAVEEVKSRVREVEAQGDSVTNTITTSFNEAIKILEQRKKEMLEESIHLVKEKVDKLAVQEKSLYLASAEVQNVIDYTVRCINHCSDNEVMSTAAEIQKRINQKEVEHSDTTKLTEPVERADIEVRVKIAEGILQLCQTKATITTLPLEIMINGEGLKIAEIDKVSKITLTRVIRTTTSVVGKLQTLNDKSIIECTVTPTGPGQYTVEYTPLTRGRHELSVLVDGRHVAGSPFSVFVSIHPTKLGKPVNICHNILAPGEVTFNNEEEAIVAKLNDNVLVFLKQGKRTTTVGRATLQLPDYIFTCLSVDAKGYLYLTLYNSRKIYKLSPDGNFILKESSVESSGVLGGAIVGDQLLVSERDVMGTIKVYDTELNYIKKISNSNIGVLRGFASDSSGNIYASDWNKKCIHVLSHQGRHICSFKNDAKGNRVLNTPLGLCVFDQFVYVCNHFDHNICVFTTEGEYVTKFGAHGSQPGQFNIPRSICSDKDGYLYVCDTDNSRVQVF